MSPTTWLPIALIAVAAPAVAAQDAPLGDDRSVTAGGEFRRIRLGTGAGATTIRQWVVPVGAYVTSGRWSFDVGSAYASTRLSGGGLLRDVSGLTDTQVRGSYTFGRDALVASVVLNLPTGRSRAPAADFPVLGAISSSFFGFPVNSYGNGFSATGGLAAAVPAGDWNLGLAGSLRVSGRFTPYTDLGAPFSYKPGIEGRIRAGVDRVVGRSRVTAGFTWSTFGTDQLAAGTTTAGQYQPGPRWLAEGTAAVPVGARARLAFSLWHYQRTAGDSVGIRVANDERLSAGGVVLHSPIAGSVTLRLGVDGRLWHQGPADGKSVGGLIGLGVPIGTRLSFTPEVRYDIGRLEPAAGQLDLRGLGISAYLRSSF